MLDGVVKLNTLVESVDPNLLTEKITPSSISFELFPIFDLEFLKKMQFLNNYKCMIGNEMKLDRPVHYQMA
jgi:hypothetical protein